eukprot:GABV01010812.1.p2 GENE.GABV01010812.1~~GABV01010812.1.p2  ORF type:complete len:101 (-),score=45.58 GABV01010812.1:25-327(-)
MRLPKTFVNCFSPTSAQRRKLTTAVRGHGPGRENQPEEKGNAPENEEAARAMMAEALRRSAAGEDPVPLPPAPGRGKERKIIKDFVEFRKKLPLLPQYVR